MEHAYARFLHLLAEHAGWSLTVVFLAAFLEAVAVIGTFVPGSTILFIAGALVGTGVLHLGWLCALAIAGAIAGDGISYWIGRRYRDTIAGLWPFRTHPAILEAGRLYFTQHGATSVVFARFAAPLRAIVPVVAGTMGMSPVRFYVMNVLSALLWSFAHILPGVVFGASLAIAGAVSLRLVTIIALLAVALWIGVHIARVVLDHARQWAGKSRGALMRWGHRHPGRVARVVLRILDPRHSAFSTLVTLTVLVVLAAAVFFGVLEGVKNGAPLVHIDLSAYRYLQSVRSPWSDAALAVVATLGNVPTLAVVVATTTVMMAYERRWRTIVFWLIAVLFSQLLILAMQISTLHFGPPDASAELYAFPSDHVAATATIYGFLAFLLTRRVGRRQGIAVAAVATVIIVAVALAGLSFGRYALSDALGGAAFAGIWVACAAMFSLWRHPTPPKSRPHLPALFLVVICASVAFQARGSLTKNAASAEPQRATVVVSEERWAESLWRYFPCYRSDMSGDRREPITLQWAANPQQIKAQLRSRGWLEGNRLNVRSVLSLVSPDVAAIDLPVLPKLNNGEPSTFVFSRSRAVRDERDVLRFWPTGYALAGRDGAPPVPIWLGSLVHERLRRPSWPFNILHTDKQMDSLTSEQDKLPEWRRLEIASDFGCEGVPVTLLTSDAR